MTISTERITEMLMDSLFSKEELNEEGLPLDPDSLVEVNGIRMRIGFHKPRLESHREEIIGMLKQLDESFFKTGDAGGQSFLNFCQDGQGHLWGEHGNAEELIVLGIGLKLISFPLPRELWAALPGGVPYVVVDL